MYNLKPEDYYSQRNNFFSPLIACMPTSYVMFCLGNKLPFVNKSLEMFGKKYTDDDFIFALLDTQEAKDFCYKKYPWAYNDNPKKCIPPREVHGMYNTYLEPLLFNKRYSDFVTNLTYNDIMARMLKKQVIMTSGEFLSVGILGHAFCFIGYDGFKDNLVVADPYGNFHTNFISTKGYGISMNEREFMSIVKPTGSIQKWGRVLL